MASENHHPDLDDPFVTIADQPYDDSTAKTDDQPLDHLAAAGDPYTLAPIIIERPKPVGGQPAFEFARHAPTTHGQDTMRRGRDAQSSRSAQQLDCSTESNRTPFQGFTGDRPAPPCASAVHKSLETLNNPTGTGKDNTQGPTLVRVNVPTKGIHARRQSSQDAENGNRAFARLSLPPTRTPVISMLPPTTKLVPQATTTGRSRHQTLSLDGRNESIAAAGISATHGNVCALGGFPVVSLAQRHENFFNQGSRIEATSQQPQEGRSIINGDKPRQSHAATKFGDRAHTAGPPMKMTHASDSEPAIAGSRRRSMERESVEHEHICPDHTLQRNGSRDTLDQQQHAQITHLQVALEAEQMRLAASNQKYEALKLNFSKTQHDLANLRGRAEDLSAKFNAIGQIQNELQHNKTTISQQVTDLSSKLETHGVEREKIEQYVRHCTDVSTQIKDRISVICKDARDQYERAEKAQKTLQDEVTQKEMIIQEQLQSIRKVEDDLRRTRADRDSLQCQIDQRLSQILAGITQLPEEFVKASELDQLRANLAELANAIEQRARDQSTSSVNQDLVAKLAHVSGSIQEQLRAFKDANETDSRTAQDLQQHFDRQIERLRHDLVENQELHMQVVELQRAKERLEGSNASTNTLLNSAKEEMGKMQASENDLRQRIADQDAEIEDMEYSIVAHKAASPASSRAVQANLQLNQQLARCQEDLTRAKEQVRTLDMIKVAMTVELDSLRSKCQSYEMALANASRPTLPGQKAPQEQPQPVDNHGNQEEKRLYTETTVDYENQLHRDRQKEARLEELKTAAEAQIAALEASIAEAQVKLSSQHRKLAVANSKLEATRAEAHASDKELTALTQRLGVQALARKGLQATLAEAHDQDQSTVRLQHDSSKLIDQLDKLMKQIATANVDRDTAIQERDNAAKEAERTLQNLRQGHRKEVEDLQRQLQELQPRSFARNNLAPRRTRDRDQPTIPNAAFETTRESGRNIAWSQVQSTPKSSCPIDHAAPVPNLDPSGEPKLKDLELASCQENVQGARKDTGPRTLTSISRQESDSQSPFEDLFHSMKDDQKKLDAKEDRALATAQRSGAETAIGSTQIEEISSSLSSPPSSMQSTVGKENTTIQTPQPPRAHRTGAAALRELTMDAATPSQAASTPTPMPASLQGITIRDGARVPASVNAVLESPAGAPARSAMATESKGARPPLMQRKKRDLPPQDTEVCSRPPARRLKLDGSGMDKPEASHTASEPGVEGIRSAPGATVLNHPGGGLVSSETASRALRPSGLLPPTLRAANRSAQHPSGGPPRAPGGKSKRTDSMAKYHERFSQAP